MRALQRSYFARVGALLVGMCLVAPVVWARRTVDLDKLTPAQKQALRQSATVRSIQIGGRAVIAISTTKSTPTNPFYNNPFPSGEGGEQGGSSATSLGSGVIVNQQGYAVTNEHVVSQATDISVRLADGRVFKAQVVGAARQFDLAVIKIHATGRLPVAKLGSSEDLMTGETVVAIGNPFGLSHTVSRGVISALNRKVQIKGREYTDFIQTDAAINPGNSGGPLVNIVGEVIGINTAIHRGGPGIGFAIPVGRVKRVVDDLLKYGEVRGAYLGLSVYNYKGPGVAVSHVEPSGPADKGGVRRGDVVLEVRGRALVDVLGFRDVVSQLVPGEDVWFKLRRGMAKLKVGSIKPELARKIFERRLGLTVDSAAYYAREMGLQTRDGAVIRTVQPKGSAAGVGLARGDVIRQLNRFTIRSLADLDSVLTRLRTGVTLMLVVQRGANSYYVTVPY